MNDRLERAGMRLRGAELPLQQPDPGRRYPVPPKVDLVDEPPEHIRAALPWVVDGPWLEWTYTAAGTEGAETPPIGGCLDAFVRLAHAAPERVRDFAQTWGVLGICHHQAPSSHQPGCHPMGVPSLGPGFEPPGSLAWEPLSAWYRYTRRARAIVTATARLQSGEDLAADDWRDIERPRVLEKALEQHMRQRREFPGLAEQEVAEAVTGWLADADLRPAVRWDSKARAFRAMLAPSEPTLLGETYGFLFVVLGVQLAAAVGSALYYCSRCGEAYTPAANRKRPQSGRRRYCTEWCSQEAKRESNLRSYHANKHRWPSRMAKGREGQTGHGK